MYQPLITFCPYSAIFTQVLRISVEIQAYRFFLRTFTLNPLSLISI